MTIAAIMVNVDFNSASKARITLAAELALRFDSLLIGVAGWPLLTDHGENVSEHSFSSARSAEWVSNELNNLGAKFRNLARGITDRLEWRSSMNFPREVIASEARAADLVVIGRDLLPDDIYHTYDPGTIILAAGRPVMVVPNQVEHVEASRVLIAWRDTREARRAIRDALPFLKRAKEVSIAVARRPDSEGADSQIRDVAQYLNRHQVIVGRQFSTLADDDEEAILLNLAEDHDINLIVAGAYGRTRLSEWIFGGVTRHLLLNSPVPCLFSN
jgi:nucleotide-binding universal stress UspA family protein